MIKEGLPDNLNGNSYRILRDLSPGISGATVAKILLGNNVLVLKKYPDSKKNSEERRGYYFLKETPLSTYLPHLHEDLSTEDFSIYEFCSGKKMRDGIKDGFLNNHRVFSTYQKILSLSLECASVKDLPHISIRSVQREEWRETLSLIDQVINHAADNFGINRNSLREKTLRYKGEQLPSLNQIIDILSALIAKNVAEQRLIPSHGDLTTGNVIVDGNCFHVVDFEWAGLHDAPESLAKTIRNQISHVDNITEVKIDDEKSFVQVDFHENLPAITLMMENYGLQKLNAYETILGVPDLKRKVLKYMAGFSLRDLALSPKRGGFNNALFALIQAAKYIKQGL